MYIQYVEELIYQLDSLTKSFDKMDNIIQIANKMNRNKNIFIIGNGGSAATAIHFAADLNKSAKLRARALVENISEITAISNDYDYNSIFLDQLKNHAVIGDVLVAISCSGNSENIMRAVNWAKDNGVFVIGLTGFDGGYLSKMADMNITIDSDNIRICEDIHLTICHMLTQKLSGDMIG